jgi:hypothetical protein
MTTYYNLTEIDTVTLFESEQADHYLGVLFGLFERFPSEDNEVFWGIIHGLEASYGYELELLKSFRRKPSSMVVIMINRMLNADEHAIGDTNLLQVLHEAATDTRIAEEVREYARYFISHQQQRTANES